MPLYSLFQIVRTTNVFGTVITFQNINVIHTLTHVDILSYFLPSTNLAFAIFAGFARAPTLKL